MTEVCRLPGGLGTSSHLLDSKHTYPSPLGFLQLSSLKSCIVFLAWQFQQGNNSLPLLRNLQVTGEMIGFNLIFPGWQTVQAQWAATVLCSTHSDTGTPQLHIPASELRVQTEAQCNRHLIRTPRLPVSSVVQQHSMENSRNRQVASFKSPTWGNMVRFRVISVCPTRDMRYQCPVCLSAAPYPPASHSIVISMVTSAVRYLRAFVGLNLT